MKSQLQISSNFRRAKVVIIENSSDSWALIQPIMQECLPEVEIIWINSVQRAIVQFEVWKNQEWEIPKLVMQDLYLPDREDGWRLLSYIKSLQSSLRYVPILVMSSSSDKSNIIKSYQYGAASYSVKPTDYLGWLNYFQQFRQYWWETVTLPPIHYRF